MISPQPQLEGPRNENRGTITPARRRRAVGATTSTFFSSTLGTRSTTFSSTATVG